MLHYYFGADDFGMREAHHALRASLDTDGMLDTNTSALAPRGLSPGVLVQHVSTIPFLASARLVIVEGLASTLGGGRNVVVEWQPFLDLLPELPPTNHVLLLEPIGGREAGQSLGRSALHRALREVPGADVREFRELSTRTGRGGEPSEVTRWVLERAARRGISVEPRAANRLVDLVGADLWVLASELEKLARYAEGRAVSVADVDLLTPEAREETIFEIVDAAVEGRAADALLKMRRNLEHGSETPLRYIAMIARQLRGMVRAAELLEAGAAPDEIASATRMAAGSYPLRKLTGQARTAGLRASEDALRAVEAADHAIKTGRLTDLLALELLVLQLAGLMRDRQPARAVRRGR
ncbi:MAG: hypothetical protein R3C39_15635 [Dehalococcoidia bacterium]